jgi:hypothetical protein
MNFKNRIINLKNKTKKLIKKIVIKKKKNKIRFLKNINRKTYSRILIKCHKKINFNNNKNKIIKMMIMKVNL